MTPAAATPALTAAAMSETESGGSGASGTSVPAGQQLHQLAEQLLHRQQQQQQQRLYEAAALGFEAEGSADWARRLVGGGGSDTGRHRHLAATQLEFLATVAEEHARRC